MEEFLFFLFGASVMGAVVWVRAMSRRRAGRNDKKHYETLWMEATQLLRDNGQLTDEQFERITRPNVLQMVLARQPGVSEDRASIEVKRAKAGLPPADTLEGMTSDHIAWVREARIRYGTEK